MLSSTIIILFKLHSLKSLVILAVHVFIILELRFILLVEHVRLNEKKIVEREIGGWQRVSVGEQEETVKPSNKREIGQDGSRSTRRPAHMAGSGLGLWQVCTRRHMGRRGS